MPRKIKGFTPKPQRKSDVCQRCGDPGPDLRTLSHAALLATGELDIPFTMTAIWGQQLQRTGSVMDINGREIPTFNEVDMRGDFRTFRLYQLKVCKRCRADWSEALEKWFRNKPTEEVLHDLSEASKPTKPKLAWCVVICPATGSRLCYDNKWRDFAHFGSEPSCVKIFKYPKAAMNAAMRYSQAGSHGKVIHLYEGDSMNAAGQITRAGKE